MAGAALHGDTAGCSDDVFGIPDDSWVVDDTGADFLGQKNLGQKANNVFAVDEAAFVVEKETAVKVAVPRDAQISTRGQNGIGCHRAVFGQKRVRDAVGKTAIGGVVQPDKAQRCAKTVKRGGYCVKGRACCPVTGINQHGQRFEGGHIDEGQHSFDIGGPGFGRDIAVLTVGLFGAELPPLCNRPDGRQPGCRIERCGATSNDLHAIVINGIVRCGDRYPTVSRKMGGGVIHLLRPGKAKIQNLDPFGKKGCNDRSSQSFGGGSAIAPDHDFFRGQGLSKAAANPVGDIFIQIDTKATTDVVGFEAVQGQFMAF